MKSWTLFGAGDNFIDDIIDAVEASGDNVFQVVYNQTLSDKLKKRLLLKKIKIIPLSVFKPITDNYFFGFVNPNKEPLLNDLKIFHLKYSNLIHPFSSVSSTIKIGQGNFIGAGCVVGARSILGNFNFINRQASIGHHVKISNFNHIGPGSVVSGCCRIGSKNFFGSLSVIINDIKVKNEICLGAGAVVVKNLEKAGTYVGIPARLLNK